MKIVNLTPHEIVLYKEGKKIIFEPSGLICRVDIEQKKEKEIEGIEVYKNELNKVIDFPNKEGELYIVSSIVGQELAKEGKKNYIVPNTTKNEIRDSENKIIGVTSFMIY